MSPPTGSPPAPAPADQRGECELCRSGHARASRPLWKLVAGREPDPSAPDQVLASVSLQRDNGVTVGSVIHVPFFTPSQAAAANSVSRAPAAPLGPDRGVARRRDRRQRIRLPLRDDPAYELFTTPAFTRLVLPAHGDGRRVRRALAAWCIGPAPLRQRGQRAGSHGVEGVGNNDGLVASVEASIHPQAIGWYILALLAALVGLAVIGQALARQSSDGAAGYATLSALGAGRRQLVLLGTARNARGGTGRRAGPRCSWPPRLSPLAPVGEARLAETATGFSFDALVLLSEHAAIVVVVLALGLWPAVRATRACATDGRGPATHPSTVVVHLAAAGAPPSALIGVRNALQRRGFGTNVPIGTAYLGTVLAVAVLCGTAVFGASLSNLTATPSLYGDAYQLSFEVVPGLPDPGLLTSIEQNGKVSGITRIVTTQVSIGRRRSAPWPCSRCGARAPLDRRGPPAAGRGRNRPWRGHHAPGARTRRLVDPRQGSRRPRGRRTVPLRVVSTIPLPVVDGFAGLGNGAVVTLAGYEAAVCPCGSRPGGVPAGRRGDRASAPS